MASVHIEKTPYDGVGSEVGEVPGHRERSAGGHDCIHVHIPRVALKDSKPALPLKASAKVNHEPVVVNLERDNRIGRLQ